MRVRNDAREIFRDLQSRFRSLQQHNQFILLAVLSLLCSCIYGYLLDGWINEIEDPNIMAQSENLFALIASSVHALCAAGERHIRQSHNNTTHINLTSSSSLTVWSHKASLRSYVIYSTLESLGLLCLNWALIFLDKHVCAIFKSNKILLVLIGEVLFLKRDMTGLEVSSILGVAVSMMLLSLSELDELSRFNYGGIPFVLIGVICAAGAPVIAKHYIFQKYSPQRTEVLFYHKFFTAIFLFMGVTPQLMFLLSNHWFETHMLGFLEMVMLSVVSYISLSLVMILIDIFGPTNSELVECTSLVTSIIFSYYFMSSGSEFVVVHFVALVAFFGALILNVYGLKQQQNKSNKQKNKKNIKELESLLDNINRNNIRNNINSEINLNIEN